MCKTMDNQLLNCLRILPGRFLAPMLLATSTLLIFWIGMSFAVLVGVLYANRPVYFSVVFFIVTGELLCDIYMLTIAAVDLYYGKQYVLAGTSWANSVLCHGLSVAVSTGLSLSIMADSLITHLSYKVVTSMIFREHHFQQKVKLLLLSFILIPSMYVGVEILQGHSASKDARDSHCAMVYWIYEQDTPSLIRLSIMITFMGISLVHAFITNGYVLAHVYSTYKQTQSSLFDARSHQRRLFRLTKNILHTLLFKLIQCLPVPSIALLHLQGTVVPQDINLMILLLTIILGGIRNSFFYVWAHVVNTNDN